MLEGWELTAHIDCVLCDEKLSLCVKGKIRIVKLMRQSLFAVLE